jgi:hypothetical protein
MPGSLLVSKALKKPKNNYNTTNKNKTIFLFGRAGRQEKIEVGRHWIGWCH